MVWLWGLNSGLYARKTNTSPPEPSSIFDHTCFTRTENNHVISREKSNTPFHFPYIYNLNLRILSKVSYKNYVHYQDSGGHWDSASQEAEWSAPAGKEDSHMGHPKCSLITSWSVLYMPINYVFRNWGSDINSSPREGGHVSALRMPTITGFGILILLAVQFLLISLLWPHRSSVRDNTVLLSYGDNTSFIYKRDQHNGRGSFWWNERVKCTTVNQLLLSNIPLCLPDHFQHFIPTLTDHDKVITLAKSQF